jgi:DNA-directed RNA polymerase specialized sigma24 family protein
MDPTDPDVDLARVAHRAATSALRGFRSVPHAVREELAQEAALRTWSTPGVRDVRGFAAQVARRLAVDWIRRAGARGAAWTDLSPVPELSPWQQRIEARMDLDRVWALLARAPGLHRDTLLRFAVEGSTVDELLAAEPGATAPREQRRDLLYKRRRRAVAWIREAALAA